MRAPRLVVATAVALPFVLGAAAGPGAPEEREAFVLADPDVVESSGLAVLPDGLVVTTNDSGDSGRVFVVDPATGRTVGTTSWGADPEDVEALAPAGPGHVWVGDVGDNRRARDSVEVLRVPVGRGERRVEPETYTLVYPDGARDAEALVADPLTGRLHVVTKGVFGGEVLAAPARLDPSGPNELVVVGEAPGIVTDATTLPGGGAVVLRTYSSAYVVETRSWQVLESWELPAQDQGEGVAVAGAELLLSTEGARSTVLAVPLPASARTADRQGTAWTAVRWLGTAYGLPLG